MIFAYVSALRNIKLLNGFEVANCREVDVCLVTVLNNRVTGKHPTDCWQEFILTMDTFAGV